MDDTWSGIEQPTGRLRIKLPKGDGEASIQQQWLIVTMDHQRHMEWRALPVVPFNAPDREE